jgi:hypothetical protein
MLCYSVPACAGAHWIQFRPASWANATDIMLGVCVALGVVYGTSLFIFAVVHCMQYPVQRGIDAYLLPQIILC